MRIVFLDFDGVLNHAGTFDKHAKDTASGLVRVGPDDMLDAACCARVQRVCVENDAKIVVSSSWRIGRSLDALVDILSRGGITAETIGCTPYGADGRRGREIESWLRHATGPVSSFVILDDDSDTDPFKSRHIKTSFHGGGMLDIHVERASFVLLRPWVKS